MKQMSDAELLVKINSPNSQESDLALKIVYRSYFPSIKRFILNNNGTENDAKDIFQDAIIIFYKQIKKKNFELTCSSHTYLYSVSRNLWLKKLAKADREISLMDSHEYIPIDQGQLELLYKKEETNILMALIERLGEECRKILVAAFFHKEKMKQIANLLGLSSEQVARNKKYKCMKALKDLARKDASAKELFINSK